MTEHSAVIFVFFFLAEYASIVLMCIFISILFLGGYLEQVYIIYLYEIWNSIYAYLFDIYWINSTDYLKLKEWMNSSSVDGSLSSITLGLKSSIMIFIFI